MKVLIVHNKYKQAGGEDAVLANEADLLESQGQHPQLAIIDNTKISGFNKKIWVALNTPYSLTAKKQFKKLLDEENPDIIHAHNFFPLYSPSIFDAAKEKGVRTVFTLHNYRTVCPTATLMFDGQINERSIHEGPFWTVPHKVYQGSYLGTAVLAAMIAFNKRRGTWQNSVDRFIALTNFARNKFIEAGFPPEKIVVKPNFIQDPHNGKSSIEKPTFRAFGFGLFLNFLD